MEFTGYTVYALPDENNHIIAINSDAFLTDTTGYIEIDHGEGDKFHHAQNHYLSLPLTDIHGRYNYKLIDGVVTEIPEADKPTIPDPAITTEIASFKALLTATDYKIIKCYEYSLVGEPSPYDITELHAERQSLRDQVNALEAL